MSQHPQSSLFAADELDLIAEIARRRGFDTSDDYLRALVNADAAIHQESAVFEEQNSALDSLRIGWKQAIEGDTVSSDDLLRALNDDA